MNRYKPPIFAWEPPLLTDGEIAALKCLQAGIANDGQQKLALATIVTKFASVGDWAFRPDKFGGERDTHIMLGRQFVGNLIKEALTRPMPPSKAEGDHHGTSPTTNTDSPAAPTRRNPKPAGRPKPQKAG